MSSSLVPALQQQGGKLGPERETVTCAHVCQAYTFRRAASQSLPGLRVLTDAAGKPPHALEATSKREGRPLCRYKTKTGFSTGGALCEGYTHSRPPKLC